MANYFAAVFCAAVPALSLGTLHSEIYTDLSINAVSRLLDINGQIGASTPDTGTVGALYRISAQEDVARFASANGDAYVALISQTMFASNETVSALLGHGKLKGFLLYDDGMNTVFSTDNSKFKGSIVNPAGGGYGGDHSLGIHWIDVTVPVFLLNDADNSTVHTRYASTKDIDNPSRRTLGVRMTFFQWAAINSEVCLRRTFCAPLGGFTVGGSLAPIAEAKQTIVIAAQMDAVSLFHDNSWGASAQAVSLASMVAMARLISKGLTQVDRESATYNVVFLAFQGEQFDNIGSGAFQNIMHGGQFPGGVENPLSVRDIKFFIELNQMLLGDQTTGGQAMRVHFNASNTTYLRDQLVDGTDLLQATNEGLPKSSIQAMRDLDSEWDTVDAVVVGSFDAQYSSDATSRGKPENYRYSRYDNAANLGITNETSAASMITLCEKICRMSSVVRQLAGLDNTDMCNDISATGCPDLTYQLLQALLIDGSMRVNTTVADDEHIQISGPSEPINRYTSVKMKSKDIIESFMFWHLSASLSLNTTAGNCASDSSSAIAWHGVTTNNGDGSNYCFNTSTFFLDAVSPAFDGTRITDSRYSTWTEATWNDGSIEIFLLNDGDEANAVLGIGLTYLTIVTFSVWHLSKHVGNPIENAQTTSVE